jgi:predicted nucleotidyltransferase
MHENLVRIKAVSEVLIGLKQEFVFVGGATVSLYNSNPEIVSDIRPTDDVDVIIELATYGGYAEIDEKLHALGFKNDIASGVICRYHLQGIIVDIMPTEPKVIGFSNKWYPEGFANAIDFKLDSNSTIRIFSLPYFMASKWEAFKGRGKNDYRTSKDFRILFTYWKMRTILKNSYKHQMRV